MRNAIRVLLLVAAVAACTLPARADLATDAETFFNTTWGGIIWPSQPDVITLNKEPPILETPNLQRMSFADGNDLRAQLANAGFKWKGWDLDGKGTDLLQFGSQSIWPRETVYHVREVPSVNTIEGLLAYRAAWVIERIDPAWDPLSGTPPPVISAVAAYDDHDSDKIGDICETSHRLPDGSWSTPFVPAHSTGAQTEYANGVSSSTRLVPISAMQPEVQTLWVSIGEPDPTNIYHWQMAESFDHGATWQPVMDTYIVGVPEPGALALLAAGGLCAAAFAWRKRWRKGSRRAALTICRSPIPAV